MKQIYTIELFYLLIALVMVIGEILWELETLGEGSSVLAFIVILDIYRKAVKKTTWTLWISSSLFTIAVTMRYIMALYECESKDMELMSSILTIIPFMYLLGYTFRFKTKKNG